MKRLAHTSTASFVRSFLPMTGVLAAVSMGAWAGVSAPVKNFPDDAGITASETVVLGDVNKDGSITIADVTMLVNQVLGKETPTVAADVNGDGAVTIADVTKLVNIVLGKDNAETIVIGGGDPTDGFD